MNAPSRTITETVLDEHLAAGKLSPGETINGDVASQLRDGADRLTMEVNGDWEFDVAVGLTLDQRETILAGGKLAELKREA